MKVILIDIETSPNLGYTWGKWDQSVIAFKKEWELLSFAYKELGERGVRCVSRPDFRDKTDLSITKAAWKVLDEADILIGHNIDAFDSPKLKAKFIEHGLAPPTPYKTIDTKKIARSQFRFNGNSLKDLAFTLKLKGKLETGGIELWFSCMEGKPEAWKRMIAYNKQDIVLLEEVYNKLKIWYPSHPNFALYENVHEGCTVCASENVEARSSIALKKRKVALLQCQDCGHWSQGGTV